MLVWWGATGRYKGQRKKRRETAIGNKQNKMSENRIRLAVQNNNNKGRRVGPATITTHHRSFLSSQTLSAAKQITRQLRKNKKKDKGSYANDTQTLNNNNNNSKN